MQCGLFRRDLCAGCAVRSMADQKRGRQMRGSAVCWRKLRVRRVQLSKWTTRCEQRVHADELHRWPNGRRPMPLQQSNPDCREDVILELGLWGCGGYRGVPVGFHGKTAGLRLQCRHHRPARQLSKAMSGRPDWHAAKLPGASGATPCSVMPGRSNRHATELRAATATASAATHQVPDRPDRHAAELCDSGDHVPSGPNRHSAELRAGRDGLSGGYYRHAAKLYARPESDLHRRDGGSQ